MSDSNAPEAAHSEPAAPAEGAPNAESAPSAPDSTPPTADPVLLASREFAREALAEITAPESIGADAGHEVHDAHVLTLLFECRLPGYPGWHWAASTRTLR